MGLVEFIIGHVFSRRRKRVVSTGDGIEDKLCWDEIERVTLDFSRVIGYGGFSTVYFARLADSSMVAVKRYGSSHRLYQVYKRELEILSGLRHHNIVQLLGFCDNKQEEGVLILEYIPNGNLEEKLHGSSTSLLPWRRRMSIAYQLAQALAHLHEKCNPRIVHGDIKPSNILLDNNLNCKLCDFGSSRMGFSSVVFPGTPDSSPKLSRNNKKLMMGSPGYTDPIYLKTGIASEKNDVYSFGVIVLELITGMEAIDPGSGLRLANKAESMLMNSEKGAGIVDRRLNGEADMEEARVMFGIAAKCICCLTGIRPNASDVVAMMRSQVSSLS